MAGTHGITEIVMNVSEPGYSHASRKSRVRTENWRDYSAFRLRAGLLARPVCQLQLKIGKTTIFNFMWGFHCLKSFISRFQLI